MNSSKYKFWMIVVVLLTFVSTTSALIQIFIGIPNGDSMKSIYLGLTTVILGAIVTVIGNGLWRVVSDERQEFIKQKYSSLKEVGEAVKKYELKQSEKNLRNLQMAYCRNIVFLPTSSCKKIEPILRSQSVNFGEITDSLRKETGS